jgi:hypothetical protein
LVLLEEFFDGFCHNSVIKIATGWITLQALLEQVHTAF